MTFRVGQKVVCVDNSNNGNLRLNEIYTISGFGMVIPGQPGVFVSEASNMTGPPFYVRRFRPLVDHKTDISIFTKMLTPQGIEA